MSPNYLTSSDMEMIERLLREVRKATRKDHSVGETAAARFLVRSIEQGTRNEKILRTKLAQHIRLNSSIDGSLDRWANEGGASA